jgi:hypothetical protein
MMGITGMFLQMLKGVIAMRYQSGNYTNFRSKLGKVNPALVFGIIIITALLAFEMFNYSTTDFALSDLLGETRFLGVRWATILAIAFCGIDFAGIARLFTPERGSDEPKEVWYLLGAWLLAATMNAILTWWGVSMAIASHELKSTAIVSTSTLTQVVPVFVSLMVWVIRILIIGTISVAGERFLWGESRKSTYVAKDYTQQKVPLAQRPAVSSLNPRPDLNPRPARAVRPSLSASPVDPTPLNRVEPTYHTLNARPNNSSESSGNQTRQF